jgi:hypothetical protein
VRVRKGSNLHLGMCVMKAFLEDLLLF